MQQYFDVATDLAARAGAYLREQVDRVTAVEHKRTDIDLVTECDVASEQLIVDGLRAAFPEHEIFAEEGGAVGGGASRCKWIIDPLDGTTNFAHGLRAFCVSIGLEIDGAPALGVVYDPMADELYTATQGGGAHLNGRPIHVSDTTEIGEAMLATGFWYDVHTNPDDNLDRFGRFLKRARALRRIGSAALDMVWVAAGRLDGFWEAYLKPWDMCAATLIVREAGGTTTDYAGRPHSIYGNTTIASNGRIHAAMVEIIKGTRGAEA